MSLKKKICLTIIIFLAISLVLIIFLVYPFFQQIQESSASLVLEKKTSAFLIQEKQELKKAKQALLKHQESLTRIDNLFIDSENPIVFIGFLEEQAQKSKIYFELSSLGPEQKKEPWPSFHFQISAAGSSSDFLKFLEGLESSPYLIEILNLNMRRLNEPELAGLEFQGLGLGDIRASVLIRVFTK